MKLAIMQPYFLPYIGYFQLIAAVDVFVVYDNIQFTKKGWIHRNRILSQGDSKLFTIPLKKDSDYLDIRQRIISADFKTFKDKLLRSLKNDYQNAPYFKSTYTLLENLLNYNDLNLFQFIYNSIVQICKTLNIRTEIVISSSLPIDHALTSQHKVIEICKHLKATHYLNTIGGLELYQKKDFLNEHIHLHFIKSQDIIYKQFQDTFVPWLSILDVMMFNTKEEITDMLNSYQLIK